MGRRCVPDFSELDLLSATLRSAMGFLLLAASSLANRPAGDVGEERRDIPRDGRSGGQVQSRGEEEGGKRLRVREVRLLVRNPEPRNLQVVTVTHPYRHINMRTRTPQTTAASLPLLHGPSCRSLVTRWHLRWGALYLRFSATLWRLRASCHLCIG